MKKFLFLTVLFLGFLLNSEAAIAQALTMDESLEAVCRVNARDARGSGTVFAEDEDKFYILTNGHVVGRASRGHVEFFQDGYKSAMIPFKTEYAAYKDGTALDLAVLSVKKKYFGRYPPRVIPLAPRGTVIKSNDKVMAGGCPSAQWACAWKGRVIQNHGATVSFNAAPIGGQSGSGVLILIKDKTGEIQTCVGILLAWRVGDGAYSDDGPTDYGAGLSLKQIYEILDGNGEDHAIEASYEVISEKTESKVTSEEETHAAHDKDKAENDQKKPKRLLSRCPHCDRKVEDHVVIPDKGGLRKTEEGNFIFCPIIKFPDGSYAETAKYYGGIRVGELYEGNGLFPWCPLNPCPPSKPPRPEPPNGGGGDGGGGGFNPWPGRPDPGGPVDPPDNFDAERQQFMDKITELQEKLSNLEALSESLKAELSGTNSNLLNSQDEIRGLRDLLGRVEGQKQSLGSRIEELLGFVNDKDKLISDLKDDGGHYLDEATGGNGNAVENVSFTLGGASIGMLALKYGVPFLLNRRRKRKRKKEEEESVDDGYDIDDEDVPESMPVIPDGGCHHDDEGGVKKHVHEHEHIHTHKHKNDFIMPPEELPDPRTTNEIDDLAKNGFRLNPGFAGYGLPLPQMVDQYHYPQPVAAHGLPPQLPNVPFSTRKTATAEQIMTIFGELINEYQNDQTMTMTQMDILLRHRLKEKYNIE